MGEDTESGYRWWLRYVIVPLIGGGGIIALVVARIDHRSQQLPQTQQPPQIVVQTLVNNDKPKDDKSNNNREIKIAKTPLFIDETDKNKKISKPNHDSSLPRPERMRLCIDSGCNNLTWADDHYNGTLDGQTTVVTQYWVVMWTVEQIQLSGKTVVFDPSGNPAIGVFTGRISPDGTSIVDGRDQWQVGSAKGNQAFTLTWDKRVSTIGGAAAH